MCEKKPYIYDIKSEFFQSSMTEKDKYVLRKRGRSTNIELQI